jgi:phosphate/sulfate permease
MDMLTPAGIVGISLALFGLPLIAAAGALALLGLLAWIGVARAEDGKARLCAARVPSLVVGAVVGLGMAVALMAATQSTLASLNGVLDWAVFLAPVLGAAIGASLVSWPVFALLRPASARPAEKPAVEGDRLRHV